MDPALGSPFHTERAPRRRRWRAVSAAIAATLVAGGVGVGVASGSASTSRYRTATVGEHHVEQSLTGVATVESVAQAAVAFPTAGTVATVDVRVGDAVSVGTKLATLDPTSLEAALSQTRADLAQAELTLERARNGETTASSPAGTTSVQTAAVSDATSTSTVAIQLSSTESSGDDELGRAQQAVVDGQKTVDEDLAEADRALASAKQICASVGEDADTTTEAADQAEPNAGSGSGSSAADEQTSVSACYQALADVLDAQQQVASAQQALAKAASELDQLLAKRAEELSKQEALQQQPETSTSAPRTTETVTPSSEDLIAYQKDIDSAAAQVNVAEQALRQATIASAIAGTVVAVNVAPGDTVTAASTTDTIVVSGGGGYEAVTMVKVTDLPDLAVGHAASFLPDGSDRAIAGQVTSIGLVSTAGTTGTTYPVTITFTGDTSALRSGSAGTSTITTAAAETALAVPTSAVHLDNGRYTVTVVDGEDTSDVTVDVGAIGATWTEVRRGLTNGQRVVLADLSEPLPGTATSTAGQQQTPFGGRGGLGGFQPPRS